MANTSIQVARKLKDLIDGQRAARKYAELLAAEERRLIQEVLTLAVTDLTDGRPDDPLACREGAAYALDEVLAWQAYSSEERAAGAKLVGIVFDTAEELAPKRDDRIREGKHVCDPGGGPMAPDDYDLNEPF